MRHGKTYVPASKIGMRRQKPGEQSIWTLRSLNVIELCMISPEEVPLKHGPDFSYALGFRSMETLKWRSQPFGASKIFKGNHKRLGDIQRLIYRLQRDMQKSIKKCRLARSLEIAILTGQAHMLSHQSNPERWDRPVWIVVWVMSM